MPAERSNPRRRLPDSREEGRQAARPATRGPSGEIVSSGFKAFTIPPTLTTISARLAALREPIGPPPAYDPFSGPNSPVPSPKPLRDRFKDIDSDVDDSVDTGEARGPRGEAVGPIQTFDQAMAEAEEEEEEEEEAEEGQAAQMPSRSAARGKLAPRTPVSRAEERRVPCLGCVNSALRGMIKSACANQASRRAAKCYKCGLNNHPCEPLPASVVRAAIELQDAVLLPASKKV